MEQKGVGLRINVNQIKKHLRNVYKMSFRISVNQFYEYHHPLKELRNIIKMHFCWFQQGQIKQEGHFCYTLN